MSRVSPIILLENLVPHVRLLRLRLTAVAAAGELATAAAVAVGQPDDARFSNWTKIESATETRTYKEAMRGGGAFDAAARGFLEDIALPQLALDANRATIERVRKRMREFLLADIANEKTADDAGKAVLAFMESLAGKEDAEPVVRVNAMLLIGELQAQDRKPWPPAAAVLAGAVANPQLPKAVRIAACVGLARHVEANRGLPEEQQRIATAALPAILVILKDSATDGQQDGQPKDAAKGPTPSAVAVENDWMVSRCLSMLPMLGQMTPATAAEVVRILGDGSRAINVRVRAAAALAAAAGPESRVDKAAAIKAINELAITALERDVAAANKLLLDRQYGGGTGQPVPGAIGGMPPGMMPPGMMPPGMMPPGGFGQPGMPEGALGADGQPLGEQLIPREACRRAAWRLSVLADAILTDDSKRGLAVLGGEASPAAVELSQSLRRAAMDLDAAPEEAVLRQALAGLKPAEPAAPAAEDPPAAAADTPVPAAAAKPPG